jgi:hypothetical protein
LSEEIDSVSSGDLFNKWLVGASFSASCEACPFHRRSVAGIWASRHYECQQLSSQRRNMEQATETNNAATTDVAERLAEATQAMADALNNINAQFESLHAKIDRIVATVDEGATQAEGAEGTKLREKLAGMEKANHDLKAQAETARRKTLSPLVTTLLAKEGVEGDALIEAPVVEKALSGLSIEQRIAVKAELARAGILV